MTALRYGFGLLALLVGMQTAPAAAANCTFQPFSTIPGADIELEWTAKSGRPCTLMLTVGRGIGVTSMSVAQQAADGAASTPTTGQIRYVSRPGFVGHDRFVIERTAESMARFVMRGTAHWTIDVQIVP